MGVWFGWLLLTHCNDNGWWKLARDVKCLRSNVRLFAAGKLKSYISCLKLQTMNNSISMPKYKIFMFKRKKKIFERQTSKMSLLRIEVKNKHLQSDSVYQEVLQRSLKLIPNSDCPNLNSRILNLIKNS